MSDQIPGEVNHEGHHIHLIGIGVWCSCGKDRGVVSVIPSDEPISCTKCGLKGAAFLEDVKGRPVTPITKLNLQRLPK